jgi:mannose-6-phosphate isomerase
MNIDTLARRPHLLELNRVERFYTGGKLLDRWQGRPDPTDGNWSEEFLVATTEYIGHSTRVKHKGLSRTRLEDGSIITLRDLIQLDELAFFGDRYAGQTFG